VEVYSDEINIIQMPIIKDLEELEVKVKTNELVKPSLPYFMSY
jgi:hypothetical protein